MLPLMSIATISSSGTSSDAKWEIVCGRPSSNTWNAACGRPRDELAVAVADGHRDLHDVDVDLFGVADALGPHRLDDRGRRPSASPTARI